MPNTRFDNDAYYYHHGMHPSQVASIQQQLRRQREAELAYRRHVEEEARRRQSADIKYQRQLAREREMIHRLRAQEAQYEKAIEKETRSEEAAMRREERRWRESEAALRTRGEYDDKDEDQYSVPAHVYVTRRRHENPPSGAVAERDTMEVERDEHMEVERDEPKVDTARTVNSILVENASDSENADEVLNSPWRNRRPSPGQLMEPVSF